MSILLYVYSRYIIVYYSIILYYYYLLGIILLNLFYNYYFYSITTTGDADSDPNRSESFSWDPNFPLNLEHGKNAVAFMFYLQFLVEIFYLFICFSWKGEYTGILFPNLCREEQDPDPRT